MVLPLYRLISFGIKVISRPLANYSKHWYIQNDKVLQDDYAYLFLYKQYLGGLLNYSYPKYQSYRNFIK